MRSACRCPRRPHPRNTFNEREDHRLRCRPRGAIARVRRVSPTPRMPKNPPPLPALTATPADEAVVAAWGKAKHHFTPEVKAAYLAFAKAEALRDLAKARHSLPVDFTAWVDSDPAVAATVYGIQRGRPAQVLAALRSLELGLGCRGSPPETHAARPGHRRGGCALRGHGDDGLPRARHQPCATNHEVPAQDSTEPPEKGEHPPD